MKIAARSCSPGTLRHSSHTDTRKFIVAAKLYTSLKISVQATYSSLINPSVHKLTPRKVTMSLGRVLSAYESAFEVDEGSGEGDEAIEARIHSATTANPAAFATFTERFSRYRQRVDARARAVSASLEAPRTSSLPTNIMGARRRAIAQAEQAIFDNSIALVIMNRDIAYHRALAAEDKSCRHHSKWIRYHGRRWCEGLEDGERCECHVNTTKPSGKKMTMWSCGKCKEIVMCEKHKRNVTDHSNVHSIRGRKSGL